MKSPLLDRLFTLARSEATPAAPPASDLEERVLADWRMARTAGPVRPDFPRELRFALLGACAVLLLTSAITFPILTGPTDPSVLLTNAAVTSGLRHE